MGDECLATRKTVFNHENAERSWSIGAIDHDFENPWSLLPSTMKRKKQRNFVAKGRFRPRFRWKVVVFGEISSSVLPISIWHP